MPIVTSTTSSPATTTPTSAEFTTFLNVRVVESDDDPEEQYYIYTQSELPVQPLSEMMRATRVLDRLYLIEIPFFDHLL